MTTVKVKFRPSTVGGHPGKYTCYQRLVNQILLKKTNIRFLRENG